MSIDIVGNGKLPKEFRAWYNENSLSRELNDAEQAAAISWFAVIRANQALKKIEEVEELLLKVLEKLNVTPPVTAGIRKVDFLEDEE